MVIRFCSRLDIQSIVRIHLQSFNDFFLSSLGEGFLKTYYRAYLDTPGAILICAEEGGGVIGFAAATVYSRGFNRKLLLRHPLIFAFHTMVMLFSKPKALARLVRNFVKTSSSVSDNRDYAELFSLAVSPEHQRKGFGRALVYSLERILVEEGRLTLSLTTDSENNASSLFFYNNCFYNSCYVFLTFFRFY